MKTENRKHPRFTLNQLVELDFGKEIIIQAEGVNISESGILCSTREYLQPGTVVYMLVTIDPLKEPHSIKCEGVAVRSIRSGKSWDTAITITYLSEGDRHALAGFLRKKG